MADLSTGNLIDAVASGFWISSTLKVVFGGGKIQNVFSMGNVKDGMKIAAAKMIYDVAGRPLVQNTVGKVLPQLVGA